MEGRGCLCKSLVWILILCYGLINTTSVHGQGTRASFYSSTCPRAEDIVTSTVASHFRSNPAIAPDILSIHFHDCIVQGCDGSVLIDGPNTEKSTPQNSGTRGYDVINAAKTYVEATCALVSFHVLIFSHLPHEMLSFWKLAQRFSWQVPTGRRDGRVSLASEASILPRFNDSIDSQEQQSATKGLNTQYFIALVGGHTIGTTSGALFSYRLLQLQYHNCELAVPIPPSTHPSFVPTLRALCLQNGDRTRRDDLDTGSVSRFDTTLFANLKNGQGVLESDQVLWTDPSTRTIVEGFLRLRGAQCLNFKLEFAKSTEKMSNIGVKTGTEGEIRRVCTAVN